MDLVVACCLLRAGRREQDGGEYSPLGINVFRIRNTFRQTETNRSRHMHITTQRLVLREFTMDDWPDVLAYQSDPRYLRFYPWTGRTDEKVWDFVQMFVDQ